MALDAFIPTLWSAQLLRSLKKSLIFAQEGAVNTEYEGEIQQYGDTVKINSIGKVTIGDYTKNTNIGDPQELQDSSTHLLIDRQKFFNFQVDDVDQAQQKPKVMGAAMEEAAYALRNEVDQYIAAIMDAGCGGLTGTTATNSIGSYPTPKTIVAATDAFNYLVDIGVLMDQGNIPETGRWAIVPAWFHGILEKDSRFTAADQTGIRSVLGNGVIKRAAGFDIMKSNNTVSNGTAVGSQYTVQVGHRMATTYADQVSQVEAYRPHQRFADAIKGLHVYGAKVIRPEALARLVVTRV